MSGSIYTASFRRLVAAEQLKLTGQTTSQWLDATTYRSGFCVALSSVAASWTIEALLPNGNTVVVGNYDSGNLFDTLMPRYITTNAMCGLPIRFVSGLPQGNSDLWVIFKS
jgi:hypothetical protein